MDNQARFFFFALGNSSNSAISNPQKLIFYWFVHENTITTKEQSFFANEIIICLENNMPTSAAYLPKMKTEYCLTANLLIVYISGSTNFRWNRFMVKINM